MNAYYNVKSFNVKGEGEKVCVDIGIHCLMYQKLDSSINLCVHNM